MSLPIPSLDDPEARALLSQLLHKEALAIGLCEEPLSEGGVRLSHVMFLPALPTAPLLKFNARHFPNLYVNEEEGYVFHVETVRVFEQYRDNTLSDAVRPVPLHFVFFLDGRVEVRPGRSYGPREEPPLPSWRLGIIQILQTLVTAFVRIEKEVSVSEQHALLRVHAFLMQPRPSESPPKDA